MKILDIKDLEDCFDGSFIKEILLDEKVTKEFIFHLGKMGELHYYPHFPRPFYNIDAGEISMKGVENNLTIRVTLYKPGKLKELENQINNFGKLNK